MPQGNARTVRPLKQAVLDSTEFRETLDRALRLVVPIIADYAFVHLVDASEDIEAIASRHRDPAKEEDLVTLLSRLKGRMTAQGSVIRSAILSGVAQQVAGTADGVVDLQGEDETLEALIRNLGPRSFMVVPLVADQAIVGSLSFARFENDEPYDQSDLHFAQAVAGQTGLAIDNTVQFQEAEQARAAAIDAAEEIRFQAGVLASVGEAVAAVDLEGTIVYWNRAAEDLYGYSSSEAVGSNLSVTAPADASRAELSEAMEALSEGRSWTGEVTLKRRGGSTFPARLTGTPFYGEDGEPQGIITVALDLTRQKALEAQLIQAQRLQAVGGLAGGVAHDLNNALTGIQGFTELILQDLPATSSARGDLAEIRESASRAAALVQQLLAFSRRQLLQPIRLDLNSVVLGMSRVLRRTITEDIELVQDLDDGLAVVYADPRQIEQVILNLVQNAVEAMPTGGRLTLRTKNRTLGPKRGKELGYHVKSGAYAELAVEDTGAGMPATVRDHAFEPFFTTKATGQGPGLGLSTVYGIIKQSKGYVWLGSGVDTGTVVTLCLPEAPPVEEQAPDATSIPQKTQRILLVEDDEAVRTVVRRILIREGYEVLEAPNGREALAVARLGDFDAVITDVVMPEMNGRQMVEHLTADRPDLPVLFISGHTDDQVARHGIAGGSVSFLAKPFTTEALLGKVRDLLP